MKMPGRPGTGVSLIGTLKYLGRKATTVCCANRKVPAARLESPCPCEYFALRQKRKRTKIPLYALSAQDRCVSSIDALKYLGRKATEFYYENVKAIDADTA